MAGHVSMMTWRTCLGFVSTPGSGGAGHSSHLFFCLGVFIFSLVTYKPLEYDGYEYPVWGQAIGWIMALSSIMCIPVVMIYKIATTPGSFEQRWTILTTPSLKNQSEEAKQEFPQESYKLTENKGML
ncbi:Sodium- and chloride-dependent creatine transporter 1 [Desmophyllum pertusum]|uniref:Sodium- and chloride-dependent creatine transporter 1 n=1 Tax=Desmophyllum pertusum TaxID=174260 RepID=A0A9W9ZE47_9CNID|nr:Sodium- and chloride-dependent creatine transporter 1 [Desmophyllum pertusum]